MGEGDDPCSEIQGHWTVVIRPPEAGQTDFDNRAQNLLRLVDSKFETSKSLLSDAFIADSIRGAIKSFWADPTMPSQSRPRADLGKLISPL
jgi:hypothetical protein